MINDKIREYIVWVVFGLSLIGQASPTVRALYEDKKLEKSNYIEKYSSNFCAVSYYAYDDNKDGKIDRIEENGIFGIAPRGQMPVRRTHLERDLNFKNYLEFFVNSK